MKRNAALTGRNCASDSLLLMKRLHAKRFIATGGFHENDGAGSFRDGIDPRIEFAFVVADGLQSSQNLRLIRRTGLKWNRLRSR